MGVVYKLWTPPRITDAREKFARAAQMKSKKEEMYIHWVRMEIEQSEWTKAANAAEKGLKSIGDNQVLHSLAGYAKTRLGKDFVRALQAEKAERQFHDALVHLMKALEAKDVSGSNSRNILSDIYRTIVIANECLNRKSEVISYLKEWKYRTPSDTNYQFEKDRLSAKYKFVLN